ncbi:VanZ family protein [Streptomyces inusitatus]|uniref:VanZ family protein n=1 Tax=Streptomyces inusitatus TaxID=68221 RepID=UPI00167D21B7
MQRQGTGGSAVIRVRVAGVLLLLVHLLLVGWLTLRPLDVPWVTAANLEPLATVKANLVLGPAEAVRRIGGGLLLLAPLGVLLPLAGGRLTVSPLGSLARTMAAGALISLAIELAQTGVPGRVLNVDSLLLNTAGVALTHLLVVPAGRARLRRTRARGRGRARAPRRPDRSRPDRSRPPVPPVPAVNRRSDSRAPRASDCGTRPGGGGTVLREDAPQGATPTIPRVGIAP